jgi:hypothetical protein
MSGCEPEHEHILALFIDEFSLDENQQKAAHFR